MTAPWEESARQLGAFIGELAAQATIDSERNRLRMVRDHLAEVELQAMMLAEQLRGEQ